MSTIPPTTPVFKWPIPLGGVRPDVRLALKDFGVAIEATVKAIQDTLTTVKSKADAAMPKGGGTFTGRVQVPDGTDAKDAVNKGQVDTALAGKALYEATPRPSTWGEGNGKAVLVRGGLAGAPDEGGNMMAVRWFALPATDSRFPGVVRWAVDTTDYGVMSIDRPSDPSLKEPIDAARATPNYAAFLAAVPVHAFRFTSDEEVGSRWAGTEHVGFMADEVLSARDANALPLGVVEVDADGRGVAVNSDDMVAVLWAVVQDLAARVEALEQ